MQRKIGIESMQENSMDHGISYNSAIFELDNQDFVWTIQKNGHPCKEKSAWKSMQENSIDHGISYNSAIF